METSAPILDERTGEPLSLHAPMPVLAAIRAYCVGCSGGSRKEVAECQVKNCELYPFRMGRNPWRKSRDLSPEQREELKARLPGSLQ